MKFVAFGNIIERILIKSAQVEISCDKIGIDCPRRLHRLIYRLNHRMEVTNVLTLANAGSNVPLAFTSTISNAFILAAIWRTPALHTATNILVFGLALSDLGVGLLSQPLGIFLLTNRIGKDAVPIFQMFSGSLSAISLLTITAISVERYLDFHPPFFEPVPF